jgi:hypothetical protein
LRRISLVLVGLAQHIPGQVVCGALGMTLGQSLNDLVIAARLAAHIVGLAHLFEQSGIVRCDGGGFFV